MGAWGHGPLDSDAALDWKGSAIEDKIRKEIIKTLRSRKGYSWPSYAYAAAGLVDMMTVEGEDRKVEAHPFWFPAESWQTMDLAVRTLDRIKKHAWMDSWGDTDQITEEIDSLRESLSKKIEHQQKGILRAYKDMSRSKSGPPDWFLKEHKKLLAHWEDEGII